MSQLVKVAFWDGQTRAAIVFVHGLSGHAYDTWRSGAQDPVDSDKTFWPRWLAEDIEGVAVYTLSYEAPASNWLGTAMPLQDRAVNVRECLLNSPDLADTPIVFICHSLGGLLVKQVMLDLKEQEDRRPEAARFLAQVKQVVFLATPHTGSHQATLLGRLGFLVWPSDIVRGLIANDPSLRKINVSYRGLADDRRAVLAHRVYYEKHKTWVGTIVDESSSDPGLIAEPVPVDADHISIAKPAARSADVYDGIRTFIARQLAGSGSAGKLVLPGLPAVSSSAPANLAPKLVRFAAILIVAVAFGALLWPRPQPAAASPSIDGLTMVSVLVAISEDNERLRVAAVLARRSLTDDERKAVIAMRSQIANAPTLAPADERAVRTATTRDELEAVFRTLEVRPCKGSVDFVIEGGRIKCRSGEPIPFLRAANTGGPLLSLEALVFHFSAAPSTESELRIFQEESRMASTHLIVARSGAIIQLVPFDRQAWHAGASRWSERRLEGLNKFSIGIMYSNWGDLKKDTDGRYASWNGQAVAAENVFAARKGGQETYWEKYSAAQIEVSRGIVRAFRAVKSDIGLLGHSDISPGRKTDPGPAFPIQMLRDLR